MRQRGAKRAFDLESGDGFIADISDANFRKTQRKVPSNRLKSKPYSWRPLTGRKLLAVLLLIFQCEGTIHILVNRKSASRARRKIAPPVSSAARQPPCRTLRHIRWRCGLAPCVVKVCRCSKTLPGGELTASSASQQPKHLADPDPDMTNFPFCRGFTGSF